MLIYVNVTDRKTDGQTYQKYTRNFTKYILGQKLEIFPRGVKNFTDQSLKKIGEKRPTKKAKKIFRPCKNFSNCYYS